MTVTDSFGPSARYHHEGHLLLAKWRLFSIGGHFYGEYFYSDAKASYFVFPVVGCIYTVICGVEVCTGAMH